MSRFEDSVKQYQRTFEQYGRGLMKRYEEELRRRDQSPWEIVEDSSGYMHVRFTGDRLETELPLDIGVIPAFDMPLPELPMLATEASLNLVLIFIYAVIYMLIGYVAFLRYDVRP